LGILHKDCAQLRAKLALFRAPMVLSVEHIFGFGLKSDVLPPDAVAIAAIVAALGRSGEVLALQISVSEAEAQPCNLTAQPQLLTIDIRKPAALFAWRPQSTINIVESAAQSRLPTHFQALV
jgi:hypothetical protein